MELPGTSRLREPAQSGVHKAMTIVVGYGRTGASAVAALAADGTGFPGRLVVLERRPERAAAASAAGMTVVVGDATDVGVLRQAGVPLAECLIVTCMEDATTVLVTARIRRLSDAVRVVVAVRDPEHVAALRHAGADLVVAVSRVTGGLLALSVTGVDAAHAARVLLAEGVHQRVPRPGEVGVPVRRCRPMVLAVVRDGIRHWSNDPVLGVIRADDVLIGWAE
ncbi:NAD(P)-binding protein [Saccharothrix carnea]|uniref:NAD(P)-binding protein n=1 Tax=Saccharothrix carnea TaxID=1280637 RepID=UPI0015E7A2C6|nr:NAD(P)-binding protein [Saccharothrix carnea]